MRLKEGLLVTEGQMATNATSQPTTQSLGPAPATDWRLDDRREQWAIEPIEATPSARRDAIFRRSLAVADVAALALTAVFVLGADRL
ncbi:MAG: hypothetical protein QOF12_1235, partial [Solirubrobacteraceae bacterium]|nr:hypothetical protein [Solirubrobacteraceae bacterium]